MKTTFSRNFSTAASILLLTLFVLGASFQMLVKEYLTETTVSGLRKDGEIVANLAASYSIDAQLSSREFLLNLDVASQVSDSDTIICDASGKIILCSDALFGCKHQGLRVDRSYLTKVVQSGGDTATGVIPDLYPEHRYFVMTPISSSGSTGGMVIVSTPTEATTQILNKISNIFLTAAAVVVLIAVLAVSIFARRESRPLREMAKAANAFGHGDLDARVRVEESYSEEIEELALAFNNMASSLQKSEYQRQEFVANVSHELKTPMTTIGGYIDGMLDGTIPPEKHSYYMQIVSDETKRLSRLVRSMLDISRLQDQGGVPEEQKLRFDIEECAGQVLITFEQKILQKKLQVEVDMPDHPVYTWANKDSITQVLYNLLDNAVKFCPEEGTIGLRIKLGRSKTFVSVSNEGQTIPPQELPLVFDRFHKMDKSRSQNRDGWGLGLYIVKTIVCSHGEDISVASQNGKTEFTFTLPLVI